MYYLIRRTPRHTWLLIAALPASTVFVLVIPDLLVGGQRSGTARYLIPGFLGLQLAVAYLLSQLLTAAKRWQARMGQVLAVTLLLGGMTSCWVIVHANYWWTKAEARMTDRILEVLNRSPNSLVIGPSNQTSLIKFITLSLDLNVPTSFWMVKDPNQLVIADQFQEVFVLNPTNTELAGSNQANYQLTPTIAENLWRLRPLQLPESHSRNERVSHGANQADLGSALSADTAVAEVIRKVFPGKKE
jgi:uncharacterized membrane protein